MHILEGKLLTLQSATKNMEKILKNDENLFPSAQSVICSDNCLHLFSTDQIHSWGKY